MFVRSGEAITSNSRFKKELWTNSSSIFMNILFLQVNNAGASGVIVDEDSLRAMKIDPATWVIM